MLEDGVDGIPNFELRARAARRETGRGLVFVVEGVEGVGKTLTCTTLHECLCRRGVNSVLLVDHYERTGRTGPGIAALTEAPSIHIETDLTLFLLYCARLSDKAHLAYRLAVDHEVVLVDRLDLSLQVRAAVAWSLPESKVCDVLSWSKEVLCSVHVLSVCLDASEEVCQDRVKGKPFRRRSLHSSDVLIRIHNTLRVEAAKRRVPIVDTSTKSVAEVIREIDLWLAPK